MTRRRIARPQKVLVTGAAGFVGGYLVDELLARGHVVIGLDNLSKGGAAPLRTHPRFRFVKGDATDVALLEELLTDCHQLVMLAAKVGGISYLNRFRYDVFAENTRLTAAAFDAAIWACHRARLRRVVVISSSHVYGETRPGGAVEGDELFRCPPSPYGVQKLTAEFMARDALAQYGLPFTIVRLFNCVGARELSGRPAGDPSALTTATGRHVLPDLIERIRGCPDPVKIFGSGQQTRNYVHGRDLARGIRLCLESDRAVNEDFNLTSGRATSVLELAGLVWARLRPSPLRYLIEPGAPLDLQRNVGNGNKAATLLGFKCRVSLEEMIDELLPAGGPAAPMLAAAVP